jgi:hypothetical protein
MQPRLELGDLRHDFNEMKQLLVHLSKESQKELVDEFFQNQRNDYYEELDAVAGQLGVDYRTEDGLEYITCTCEKRSFSLGMVGVVL